jgi:hypothetical protein
LSPAPGPVAFAFAFVMSAIETESSHVPEQLVQQLLKGYDGLIFEVKALNEQRSELENKVSWAKQQVQNIVFMFLVFESCPLFMMIH